MSGGDGRWLRRGAAVGVFALWWYIEDHVPDNWAALLVLALCLVVFTMADTWNP
jgi:hypothetical protein